MASIHSLPAEILREVLTYLPIPYLFAFGLTSKHHHLIQLISLQKLRLGVFPTRLNGLLSLMESSHDSDTTHAVQIVLDKRKTRGKDMVIHNQNVTTRKIVEKNRQTLRDLEVSLWDLQKSSADALSTLHRLRRLAIRLDHPNVRYAGIDKAFWATSPGSTVWNQLYSEKGDKKCLGRLQSLTLERAGITDYQLQRILDANPYITKLRLQKCLTLSAEFFETLSNSRVGQQLELLHFTQSDNIEIDDQILPYIEKMKKLKVCCFVWPTYSEMEANENLVAFSLRLREH